MLTESHYTGYVLRALCVALLAGGSLLPGCSRNARLADKRVGEFRVQTVTDQGIELGPQADPRDVVFVLLKAIRDDLKAGNDLNRREQALDRQYAVSDPDFIYKLYQDVFKSRANKSREEWVTEYVRKWAPTLGHYVDQFGFDRAEGVAMMLASDISGKSERSVEDTLLVELPLTDPGGSPHAAVLAQVRLHKTKEGYWRVFQVGFSRKRPRVSEFTIPATSRPAAEEHTPS
jgi:hypothetical protein